MPSQLLAARPARAVLFCDFDGTLAEIVPDPGRARPVVSAPGLLRALALRLARVVVVSGRPVDFLAEHLPREVDLVGLYGLESRIDGRRSAVAGLESWRASVSAAAVEAVAALGPDAVEPKGVSLTLHYRASGADPDEVEAFARRQAAATGLRVRPARKSFELHPPVHHDKGTAVLELAGGLDPVVYVGDDVGDLPAFDALDELAGRGVATSRVAVRSDEAPPELRQRADCTVDGPAGVERLLADTLSRLESQRPSG